MTRVASQKFLYLGLILVLSCSEAVAPSQYQATVNAVIDLATDVHCPGQTPAAPGSSAHPDPPDYFSVLTHLRMQEGHVLDYVYRTVPLGGLPVLYARPENRVPLHSYDQLVQDIATGDVSLHSEYGGMNLPRADEFRRPGHVWQRWLSFVRTDGTADGFFELAVLRTLGTQFCLAWHANYDDHRPVCDHTGLDALLNEAHFDHRLPRQVRRAARQLDVEPVVLLSEDTAAVSLIVFTKWGGFLRRTTTFSRDYPHRIINEVEETLVEYECNVRF